MKTKKTVGNAQFNTLSEGSIVAKYLNKFYKKQPEIKGRLIFRGQANEEWNVLSSAGRRLAKEKRFKQNDYIRYHVNLIANARKNGYNKLEAGSKLCDLEILAEIQHFGGATCLTDFSTNFLVALWFASQKHSKKVIVQVKKEDGETECKEIETNGKIVWLDLGEDKNFNNISYYNNFKEGDTIQHLLTKRAQNFDLKKDVKPRFWLWEPTKLNNRIIKQDSVFLFGLPAFSSERILFDEIPIEQVDKSLIRQELDSVFGINAETVFFDLTGYSNDANAPEMPISEKLLSNKHCLDNAKECIKKEQYSIAKSYIEEAIVCKSEMKGCKKNRNDQPGKFIPCENNSIGELYYWIGEAYEGKAETNEALLAYYQAATNLNIECKNNKEQKLFKLLSESFRKQSIIHYSKKDYNGAINADKLLEEQFQQNSFPDDNQNGADAIFSLLELSIFKFDQGLFEKYLSKAIKINPVKNNGEILLFYLSKLGKAIFNQTIDIDNFIEEIEKKAQAIIEYRETNNNKRNLIGYYYWNYNDTIIWIDKIKSLDNLSEDHQKYKSYIKKHAYELILLAQKADEAQSKLYNWTFTEYNAVETKRNCEKEL